MTDHSNMYEALKESDRQWQEMVGNCPHGLSRKWICSSCNDRTFHDAYFGGLRDVTRATFGKPALKDKPYD